MDTDAPKRSVSIYGMREKTSTIQVASFILKCFCQHRRGILQEAPKLHDGKKYETRSNPNNAQHAANSASRSVF